MKVSSKKGLNIVHISYEYPPNYFGGIGIFMKDLVENLSNDNHYFLISPGDSNALDSESVHGVTIYYIKDTFLPELRKIDYLKFIQLTRQKLKWLRKEHRIDFIHIHDLSLVNLFHHSDPVKVLLTHHKDIDNWSKSEIRGALKRVSYHIFVSKYLQAQYRKIYPFFKSRVIYNGINFNTPKYLKKINGCLSIGYMGRFNYEKGFDRFLDIIRHFSITADIDFLVVGKGDLLEDLNALCSQYHQVVYKGFLDHEECQKVYQGIDILIVPSRKETFGLVALEGLYHHKKVIVSKIPAFKEVLKNRKNVQFINFNHKGFLKQLEGQFKNYNRFELDGEMPYDISKTVWEYEDVYRSI